MATKKIPADCMPACISCAFYSCEPKDDLGYCNRYPPTLMEIEGNFESCFPVTERTDWCGEFTRKVN
jgi:hypothetical protein